MAAALAAWLRVGERAGGFDTTLSEVNGQPGVVVRDADGGVLAVWAIGVAGDRIQSIRSVVNPDKLGHLGPVGEIGAVLERARRNAARGPAQPPG